jgi:hypothetical protein
MYASTSGVAASAVSALSASTAAAINTVANLFVPTSLGGFPLSSSSAQTTSTGGATASSAADGGFVLYPNMSNTNQMQSVYSKH